MQPVRKNEYIIETHFDREALDCCWEQLQSTFLSQSLGLPGDWQWSVVTRDGANHLVLAVPIGSKYASPELLDRLRAIAFAVVTAYRFGHITGQQHAAATYAVEDRRGQSHRVTA